ncbi:hypothetical protein ASPFODRAFT_273914 [Aspergillus luchuensis CBS 106.47]|uniref:Uncharacterized protein n=1 Tax=Aspergillus luchuensis (strain CBS 106.47) TaxID=1137211 RepID=A0A1M3U135_ASPLC|nr:hypothetical protein ASPFODRAFT_273914 [Aspergillus luchuensis CBS 106.47]
MSVLVSVWFPSVVILFSCCLSPTGDHDICSGSIMSCHIMCRLAGLCSQVLLFLISFPLFCLLNVSLSTKPCCMCVCVSTKNATRAFLNFTGCALIATSSRGVNYRHLTSAISNDSSFQRHVENLPRCNRIVTPAALFPSNAEKP